MRNFKVTLEYDGTNYAGWQTQKQKHKTIQEILEKTLQKVLSEKVKVIGSGRTDAGVHAFGQVANFKTNSNITPEKLGLALNALLPPDIAVIKAEEVGLNFQAIRDVKTKVYRYTILNRKYRSALLRERVYFYHFPLDVNLMRQEARSLVGRHDFKAFCASRSSPRSTVRTIKKVSLKKISYNPMSIAPKPKDYSLIAIDIEADGFLYNMVRSIVGTLIDIGRGRFKRGSLKKILFSKDRKRSGTTAPSCGLCLLEAKY